jgi:hypothetical protein
MERICMIFFRFFVNFVSSCVRYVHGIYMETLQETGEHSLVETDEFNY